MLAYIMSIIRERRKLDEGNSAKVTKGRKKPEILPAKGENQTKEAVPR